MDMGHNVITAQDHARAVYEVTATNLGEVRKAVDALDQLGIRVKTEKDKFNKIRNFAGEIAAISKFKATELNVDDVLREAREDAPKLDEIAARVSGTHLHELRQGLAVHGEAACSAIDKVRADLHARWLELSPEVGHFSAEDAITHDRVDLWREFRTLAGQWSTVRVWENALLRVNALPSERGRNSAGSGRVRKGHDVWQRYSGLFDLRIEDDLAPVAYAVAAEKLEGAGDGVTDANSNMSLVALK